MPTVGSGRYTYEMVEDWAKLPQGQSFDKVTSVAVDSRDRVYVFQRTDPPILVFGRDGNFLSSWGNGTITFGHGIHIGRDDYIYLTDRDDHVAVKFTLDGKPVQVLGARGQPSDTGCTEDAGTVPRAAGPFNMPTSMAPAPSGDLYVADGYRNSRVHRFSAGGALIHSWGSPGKRAPGEFHVPHCVWVNRQGTVYVCDRDNSRVQVFTADGEFVAQWTDLDRPTSLYMDAEETVYVSELAPRVGVWDKAGNLLACWESPVTHFLYGDSAGDLYLALPYDDTVVKYVRQR